MIRTAISIVLLGLGLASVLSAYLPAARGEDSHARPPAMKLASELSATAVTPVLNHPIETGKNVLWCPSFQLAWNELRDTVVGEGIQLQGGPDWLPILNATSVAGNDLAADAYVAMAGSAADNIVVRINEALRSKFPPPVPKLNLTMEPNAILAYAYLRKSMRFDETFDVFDIPLRFESDKGSWGVASFGIKSVKNHIPRQMRMALQVSVAYYKSDAEFIVVLKPLGAKDEIVLAKVPPRATLGDSVEAVMEAMKDATPRRFAAGQLLCVPKVSFDVWRFYGELKRKYLLNPSWQSWYIDEASQRIEFELNERGATLSSEARIQVKGHVKSGRFVFDKPFLIMLRQVSGARPYFAAWIANAELLQEVRGVKPAKPREGDTDRHTGDQESPERVGHSAARGA